MMTNTPTWRSQFLIQVLDSIVIVVQLLNSSFSERLFNWILDANNAILLQSADVLDNQVTKLRDRVVD